MEFDLVLSGGDAVVGGRVERLNIGVRDGRIAAVTSSALLGQGEPRLPRTGDPSGRDRHARPLPRSRPHGQRGLPLGHEGRGRGRPHHGARDPEQRAVHHRPRRGAVEARRHRQEGPRQLRDLRKRRRHEPRAARRAVSARRRLQGVHGSERGPLVRPEPRRPRARLSGRREDRAGCSPSTPSPRRSTARRPPVSRTPPRRTSARGPRCPRPSRSRRRSSSRASTARGSTSRTSRRPAPSSLVRRAKEEGLRITAATCPHYLHFVGSDAATEGNALKVNPSIKSEADREALIEAIRTEVIDHVHSDHAPHKPEEKARPYDEAPSGIAGAQWEVPALLHLVHEGRLTLPQVASLICENPARAFGLSERGRDPARLARGPHRGRSRRSRRTPRGPSSPAPARAAGRGKP